MKILFDFKPANESDTSVTITSSTAASSFPASNLKNLQPVKSWKSTVITESFVLYDFGINVTYDSLFVNRFNFAAFKVYAHTSNDPVIGNWTLIEDISSLTKDEIYDENYMHRFVALSGTYRYLKIVIPTQTPLFDQTYFKIGNMLVGNAIDVWNPKAGFSVGYVPKLAITEFKSGYIATEVLGRTKRTFNGVLSKVNVTESDKFRLTFKPFVLYLDYTSNATKCYLVQAVREFTNSYEMVDIVNLPFAVEEIV